MIITVSHYFRITHHFDGQCRFLPSNGREVAYHQGLYKAKPGDWQMSLISTIPNDRKSAVSMGHSIK